MGRLSLMIGGGFAVAIFLKRFALTPERLRYHALHIDGLIVVCLVVIAISIMAGVTETFFLRPGYVLLAIAAAFLANVTLQIIGSLIFLPVGRRIAFTTGHMTGNCNMALVLAVLAERLSQMS